MSELGALPVAFETDDIVVLRQEGEPAVQETWVTFSAYTSREAACRGFLARRRASAWHVVSKKDDWYQSRSADLAVQHIARALDYDPNRVVTFGVSMGGFGSIAFAKTLSADVVIAVSPQLLVDDERTVGHDDRWRDQWRALAKSGRAERPSARLGLPAGAVVYCIVDPWVAEDRWHMQLIENCPNVRTFETPLTGHEVLIQLLTASVDQYTMLMDGLATANQRKARAAVTMFNASRRSRPVYWQHLGEH